MHSSEKRGNKQQSREILPILVVTAGKNTTPKQTCLLHETPLVVPQVFLDSLLTGEVSTGYLGLFQIVCRYGMTSLKV